MYGRFTIALAAAACWLVSGCSDFDPYAELNTLRVVGIQSEPVAPAPGETTELAPLIYSRLSDPILSFQWSWCPLVGAADDGYPCLFENESELALLAAAQGVDVGTVPPFNLGTAQKASFTHALNPALLSMLCSPVLEGVSIVPDCENGFPVQVRLVIKTATEEVTTIRTLSLRLDASGPVNTNPVIGQIFATPPDAAEVLLDELGSVTLVRSRKNKLRVEVAAENSQPYMSTDEHDQPLATQERLFLSWFVETGNIKFERTSFVAGEIGLEKLTMNEWEPESHKDYPPGASRIVVVIRDNRDGVSWRSALVKLEDPK